MGQSSSEAFAASFCANAGSGRGWMRGMCRPRATLPIVRRTRSASSRSREFRRERTSETSGVATAVVAPRPAAAAIDSLGSKRKAPGNNGIAISATRQTTRSNTAPRMTSRPTRRRRIFIDGAILPEAPSSTDQWCRRSPVYGSKTRRATTLVAVRLCDVAAAELILSSRSREAS